MRIYVASKFENKETVRDIIRQFTELGHFITHDWTWEDIGERKGEALVDYGKHCANTDFNGVITCEVFFLLNYLHCAGAYTELGLALALNKTVVVVDGFDPTKSSNIFFYMNNVNHFDRVHDAIRFVHEKGRKRQEAEDGNRVLR